MRRKLPYFIFSLFLAAILPLSSLTVPIALAAPAWNCQIDSFSPNPLSKGTKLITNMIINTNGQADPNKEYIVQVGNWNGGGFLTVYHNIIANTEVTNDKKIRITEGFNPDGQKNEGNGFSGEYIFLVVPKNNPHQDRNLCGEGTSDIPESMKLRTINNDGSGGNEYCKLSFTSLSGEFKPGDRIKVTASYEDTDKGNAWYGSDAQQQDITTKSSAGDMPVLTSTSKNLTTDGVELSNELEAGTYYNVTVHNHSIPAIYKCQNYFKLDSIGGGQSCSEPNDCTKEGDTCLTQSDGRKICGSFAAGKTSQACIEDPENEGEFICRTAIGNVSTDPGRFIQNVLKIVLGLAGGILLFVIILNGYKFMVSQGDPEKIKDAREGIIAAIAGILLIIFSLSALGLITSSILQLPGFR